MANSSESLIGKWVELGLNKLNRIIACNCSACQSTITDRQVFQIIGESDNILVCLVGKEISRITCGSSHCKHYNISSLYLKEYVEMFNKTGSFKIVPKPMCSCCLRFMRSF